MKRLKWGGRIVAITYVYYLMYNTAFGWNAEPINETEALFDSIFFWSNTIGWLIYLSPLISLYEGAVEHFFTKSK